MANTCKKCGRKFEGEEQESVCPQCQKSSNKYLYIGIISVIVVVLLAGKFYLDRKNRITSFDGVNTDQASAQTQIQGVEKYDLNETVAVPASVGNVAGNTIVDIAAFTNYMDDATKKAEAAKSGQLAIADIGVLFGLNSSQLSDKSVELLKEYAKNYLATNKTAIISVAGYTCDLGADDINDSLSKSRAQSVSQLLSSLGVANGNLQVKWHGESFYGKLGYKTREDYRRVNISISR